VHDWQPAARLSHAARSAVIRPEWTTRRGSVMASRRRHVVAQREHSATALPKRAEAKCRWPLRVEDQRGAGVDAGAAAGEAALHKRPRLVADGLWLWAL
jgi:hypothetical protein